MSVKKELTLFKNFFSASKRSLPDFIIIGAQKSGTSSLFHYLIQHPAVISPIRKEIHYFETYYRLGPGWYRAHFPKKNVLKQGKLITGEASPCYMLFPEAIAAIKSLVPQCKMIVLLREPAARAISSYYHQVNGKKEKRPVKQALFDNDPVFNQAKTLNLQKKLLQNKKLTFYYRHYSYLERGHYASQLKWVYDMFDKKHVLIDQAENLFSNPEKVYKKICRFLKIDDTFLPPDLKPQNTNHYPEIDLKVKEKLKDYYRPFNKTLKTLTEGQISWNI